MLKVRRGKDEAAHKEDKQRMTAKVERLEREQEGIQRKLEGMIRE